MSVASYDLTPLPEPQPFKVKTQVLANAINIASGSSGTNQLIQSITLNVSGVYVIKAVTALSPSGGVQVTAGSPNTTFITVGSDTNLGNAISATTPVPQLAGGNALDNTTLYLSETSVVVYVPYGQSLTYNQYINVAFTGSSTLTCVGGSQSNSSVPCSITATRVA